MRIDYMFCVNLIGNSKAFGTGNGTKIVKIILILLLFFVFYLIVPKPLVMCSDGCAFLYSTDSPINQFGIFYANIFALSSTLNLLIALLQGSLSGPNNLNLSSVVLIALINIAIIYLCYKFAKFIVFFNKNKKEYSKKHYLILIIGLLILCFYILSPLYYSMIASKNAENDKKIYDEIALQKLNTAENVKSTAEKCKSLKNTENNFSCVSDIIRKVNNINFCDIKLYEDSYIIGGMTDRSLIEYVEYECKIRLIIENNDPKQCAKYMTKKPDIDNCRYAVSKKICESQIPIQDGFYQSSQITECIKKIQNSAL